MRFLLGICIIIVFQSVSFSAVIEVPKDYSTIQGGIDAAAHGDTVLVAPGTYIENIDFKSKAITVTSRSGPNVTVIDGNQADTVVSLSVINMSYGCQKINGFTITNGYASQGGGIETPGCIAIITNNIIHSNTASGGGGGILCLAVDTPGYISNNIIYGNTAAAGGGIYCFTFGDSCSYSYSSKLLHQ